jgi:S1-C subfamily serine protease
MKLFFRTSMLAALCASAAAAQQTDTTRAVSVRMSTVRGQNCEAPGGAFGVSSIQCTNCRIALTGNASKLIFQTEPVILAMDEGALIIVDGVRQESNRTPLKAGDIIEAINGNPITTVAGSEMFSHPPAGESRIAVRRGSTRETLSVPARACSEYRLITSPPTKSVGGGGRSATKMPGTATKAVVPARGGGAVTRATSKANEFGFAIVCTPTCARARVEGDQMTWVAEGVPKVVSVDSGSAAQASGMRVGDTIIEVDGTSVLELKGAEALRNADTAKALRLKVRRADGTTTTFDLKARPTKQE